MASPARTVTVTAVFGAALLAATALAPAAPAAVQTRSQRVAPMLVLSDPNADVASPALSYSGRFLAYESLRRTGSSPRQRILRADLVNGGSVLLNPSIDGGVAAGNNSLPPIISSDGSRVAYNSSASRLVAGDTNGSFDAFVRDVTAGATRLASVAFDGQAANSDTGTVSLSKNGRYAVFTSSATDVVPGSTTTNSDVYLRDLQAGTTVQVTLRPDGSPSRGPGSSSADVSANGNVVVFNSYDTDLTRTDGDQESDLFVRYMRTGRTRWISDGVPAGASPGGVVISPDGQWASSRWADGSLHLTTVGTGATSTVVANGYAVHGSFSSALGRLVFVSSGRPYVRDLASGVNTAIQVPSDGGTVSGVTVSGNGQYAAYDWVPADGGPLTIYRVAL